MHRTFDVLPLFSSSREILGGWTHDRSRPYPPAA
jgi:hypothetical protein